MTASADTTTRRDGEVTPAVRWLTAAAAVSLVVASLIHSGYLVGGYRHQDASVAEAVIGGVMLVGLAATWLPRPWGRRAALGALGFGLVGASVGMFLVVIGVGPRSVPDVVYHVALIVTIAAGLFVALRDVWRRRP